MKSSDLREETGEGKNGVFDTTPLGVDREEADDY
jgi:hypothetical protein